MVVVSGPRESLRYPRPRYALEDIDALCIIVPSFPFLVLKWREVYMK